MEEKILFWKIVFIWYFSANNYQFKVNEAQE